MRFQFIQNEVIRVQKDDLLAALTSHGQGSPCDQLVSVDPNQGTETLTANVGIGYTINETRTLPTEKDFGIRRADPAIKAFISGMYYNKECFDKIFKTAAHHRQSQH